MCAKGLVMGLYDNLGDKLFYTRGILQYRCQCCRPIYSAMQRRNFRGAVARQCVSRCATKVLLNRLNVGLGTSEDLIALVWYLSLQVYPCPKNVTFLFF